MQDNNQRAPSRSQCRILMSRLASFKGPSTPSQSPVRSPLPNSPSSRPLESTYHRRVRVVLKEVQSIAQTWDNLVLVDGLRAAQSLIDTRTELECDIIVLYGTPFIALISNELGFSTALPSAGLVTSKIELMETRLADLDSLMDLLVCAGVT